MKTKILTILTLFFQLSVPAAASDIEDRCQHKLSRYENVRQLNEQEYRRITGKPVSPALMGQFYQVDSKSGPQHGIQTRLLWLIPFAKSEACVVRESFIFKKIGV